MAASVRPVVPPQPDAFAPNAFAEAHRRLIGDGAIQFDLPDVTPPPPPPDWLIALLRMLKPLFAALGPVAPYLHYVLWAAGAAILLFVLWRLYRRYGHLIGRRPDAPPIDETWRPEAAPARALLREADALAEAGRFAEAARLLLQRSIEEIVRHRPRLIRPALTSRGIAAATALPEPARATFGLIARTVERGLFAGRAVDGEDWRTCRAAYEDFALPPVWR